MQTNYRQSGWRLVKRVMILFPLWTTLLAGNLKAGTIIAQVSSQGGDIFRYQFFPSDITLLKYQEIDIQFDPSRFGSLFNGVADGDFQLVLLQPNNPVGSLGDYSAMALIDNPSLAGPFGVDVTWLGTGTPGGLPYVIHQFDASGQHIIGTIGSGSVETPEPAGWFLSGMGLVIGGFLRTVRRRR